MTECAIWLEERNDELFRDGEVMMGRGLVTMLPTAATTSMKERISNSESIMSAASPDTTTSSTHVQHYFAKSLITNEVVASRTQRIAVPVNDYAQYKSLAVSGCL